jgi:hypothetical protein
LPTSADCAELDWRSSSLLATVRCGNAGTMGVSGDAGLNGMCRGRSRNPLPGGPARAFTISNSPRDMGLARAAPKEGWVGCRTFRLPPRRSRALGRHHQPCGGSRRNAISDCPVIIRNSVSVAPIQLRRPYPHSKNQPITSLLVTGLGIACMKPAYATSAIAATNRVKAALNGVLN